MLRSDFLFLHCLLWFSETKRCAWKWTRWMRPLSLSTRTTGAMALRYSQTVEPLPASTSTRLKLARLSPPLPPAPVAFGRVVLRLVDGRECFVRPVSVSLTGMFNTIHGGFCLARLTDWYQRPDSGAFAHVLFHGQQSILYGRPEFLRQSRRPGGFQEGLPSRATMMRF